MANLLVPTNDATTYVVRINSVDYTSPPSQEFPALAISVVTPDVIRVNGININVLNCRVYDQTFAQGVKSYYFSNAGNNLTIAGFLTLLSGDSIVNDLTTYNGCMSIGGANLFAPVNILVNQKRIIKQLYVLSKDTTKVTIDMGKFTQKVFMFNGDLDIGAVFATASLAVPILASPANTDTLTAIVDGVTVGTYTVSGSPSQATVKAAIDALFNSNTLGYTFVGTLAANIDTLAITSPLAGTTYNGKVVGFTRTGTTFGAANVNATLTGGA